MMKVSWSNGQVCFQLVVIEVRHALLDALIQSFPPLDRVAELEKTVHSFEKQLEDQAKEAENAIAGWQESYERLETENVSLASSVKTLTAQLHGDGAQQQASSSGETEVFKSQLADLEAKLSEKEEELRLAQGSLVQVNDAVELWKGRSVIRTRY
jgi:chromosome segregation ATPase